MSYLSHFVVEGGGRDMALSDGALNGQTRRIGNLRAGRRYRLVLGGGSGSTDRASRPVGGCLPGLGRGRRGPLYLVGARGGSPRGPPGFFLEVVKGESGG